MKRYRGRRYIIFIVAVLLLCSCGKPGREQGQQAPTQKPVERVDTGFIVTDSGSYDSADTAVLVEKNTREGTLTFLNLNVGRRYTLNYDGTTRFMDKYGESMSADQMKKGDIAELTFLKGKKHLTTMVLSGDTWKLERVTYYEIDSARGEVTIGQETKKYRLSPHVLIYAEGKEIAAEELSPVDILTFQGIDSEVLTITVEQGHGYLRLQGDEKFLGGWLEIGQSQIHRITEGMVVPVAEGTYRILVTKGVNSGEKTAEIRRNEECVIDLGDIPIAEPEWGSVLFSLTPSSAQIYVDGEKVDPALPVTLLYGLHQVMVKAEGYQSITQYLKVGQAAATVDITLDPVTVDSTGEDSSYQVSIDAPIGAEVYLDGKYIGMAPCSFPKVEGEHVVTLKKNGYISKTYTIKVDGEEKDSSYSFPELETGGLTDSDPGSLNDIVSGVIGSLIN